MYSSINLIVYYEKNTDDELKKQINSIFCQHNTPFKELHSVTLLFHAIKNPQNYIVILVNTLDFLKTIENVAQNCYDYQNRVFIIHQNPNTIDYYFHNHCLPTKTNALSSFLQDNINTKKITVSNQQSTLLYKLVKLEIERLEISPKYVGFNYLIATLTNSLSNNYYSNDYIDLFKYVASTNLATIDTVERDIRHMLSTSWKRNIKFKEVLQNHYHLPDKPNSKALLEALINYLKNII